MLFIIFKSINIYMFIIMFRVPKGSFNFAKQIPELKFISI